MDVVVSAGAGAGAGSGEISSGYTSRVSAGELMSRATFCAAGGTGRCSVCVGATLSGGVMVDTMTKGSVGWRAWMCVCAPFSSAMLEALRRWLGLFDVGMLGGAE